MYVLYYCTTTLIADVRLRVATVAETFCTFLLNADTRDAKILTGRGDTVRGVHGRGGDRERQAVALNPTPHQLNAWMVACPV